MSKTGKIILIVVLSIIALMAIMLFVYVMANRKVGKIFDCGYTVSENLIFDKTYTEKYKEIEINATAGDIEITNENTEEVKVMIYGEESNNKVNTTEEKLTITSNQETCKGFFCIHLKITKIKVTLPNNYDGKIKITNNFGDIQIGDFANAELAVKMDAGDIEVGKILTGTIENKYGDISVEEAIQELTIKEDCGDVELKETYQVNVENKYGDIKIQRVNHSMKIEDDCGDIEIKSVNLQENSSIKNDYGDIEIGSTNQIYIDAKTNLGKVDINNNYPKSNITLTIEDSCGDIEVEN